MYLQLMKFALGASALTLINCKFNPQRKKCCGIIGVITKKNDATELCMEGIELLQNRGYDSAGMATIHQSTEDFSTEPPPLQAIKNNNETISPISEFHVSKFCNTDKYGLSVDCISRLKEAVSQPKHQFSSTAIGHTRWATCGGKVVQNAHPHLDQNERIALIHNGTIDNVKELRQIMKAQNIELKSDTDSELIVQLIGLKIRQGLGLFDATKKILSENIYGTWGLVIIDRMFPKQMVVCRNGSPIQVGYNSTTIFAASERIAFQKYTNTFITLKDKEIILLDIDKLEDFDTMASRVEKITQFVEIQTVPRFPYKTFFEQEIEEQPEAIMKCFGNGARLFSEADSTKLGGLASHVTEIQSIQNMIVLACGSSFYAGSFALPFFKKLDCFNTISIIEASEFVECDLPKENGGIIIISQSGETQDLYQAVQLNQLNNSQLMQAKKQSIFSLGIINVVGSLLASSVDCGIYLNCGREIAVPATKSFTSQICALLLAAIWISNQKHITTKKALRSELKSSLERLPIQFGKTLEMTKKSCLHVAEILAKEKSLMILGKGSCSAIAKEGALKIKEVTYIHAEAFSSGELKHGPLALLDSAETDPIKQTKVIIIILNNEDFHHQYLTLRELKANNAFVIALTDCPQKIEENTANEIIEIESYGTLTSLLCVVVFQRLANDICMILHYQPDKPRNLAKTVTVK